MRLVFIISTVFFLGGLIIIYWIHNQNHFDIVVSSVPVPSNTPLISICVPARNEEHNLRTCIEAILAQTYPNFELIVLDDRSTDATPAILKELSKDPRLHILNGSNLPAGWAGKPYALHQASMIARGDWLCFVDADTFLAPEALASCYAQAMETNADLFTVMTFQITGTFWEKVVLPLVMTALSVGFSPRKVNDPLRRDAIANGQFIMIKHSVYDAIGGYEHIKDQIVEDKAIAEEVKKTGFRLVVADGRKLVSTRMYTSLTLMWEGWTKNIYLGLRDQPTLLLLGALGAFLLFVAAFFLPLWPLLGLFWALHRGGWMALAIIAEALILWGVLIYVRAAVAHGMGISVWYALTTPLGAAVFTAMMLTSSWKVLSGRGVTWKGRKYNPG
jgi:chlorobactene glucosyltransferase